MTDTDRIPAEEPLEGELLEPEVVEGEVIDAEAIDDLAVLEPGDLGLMLPDDPAEARQALLQEIARARRDSGDYLGDLQRLAAEFENYRKRVVRERSEVVQRASQRVVEGLLPVLDSFDAAFTHEPQTPTEEKLVAGIRSTYHQLLDVLKKEGLEVVPTLGETFDPEVHEAVSAAGGGDGNLVVAQELRRGYRLGGRVIRPALVTVEHEDHA